MPDSSSHINDPSFSSPETGNLKDLALLFFRLGATSFGGPAVHIAMMEDEVVKKRRWLTPQQFLDMLAATNFIPGPNSTEMAIHVGYERAGMRGLLIAGAAFITPAFLIVSAIAAAYVYLGGFTVAQGFMYGIKPVVIAVVLQALWRLGKSALKTSYLVALAAVAAALNFAGVGELWVLFLAALAGLFGSGINLSSVKFLNTLSIAPLTLFIPSGPAAISFPALAQSAAVTLGHLFFLFLKIGSVLFGSGYVLLAFLRSDFVEELGWLSEAQLLDAIAIGQVTPGPVFTTATFIGYLLSGFEGAVVATCGIFLPAFFFVAVSAPLLPFLRRSPTAARVLNALNAASLAIMAVVTVHLTIAAIVDWMTTALAVASGILLIKWRVNSSWLVLGAGTLGAFKTLLAL
ncbi:MAG: chromate efflux transporter [Deltaproteobacteria bacterium]|nr:chromate efflux transporter [Deltaproteobacteria bacterium]